MQNVDAKEVIELLQRKQVFLLTKFCLLFCFYVVWSPLRVVSTQFLQWGK